MDWTLNLSQRVWDALASCIGLDMVALRKKSMCGAIGQSAFIRYKIRPALALPYSLCAGDVDANLDRFKAETAPSEQWSTPWKIHRMLNMDQFSRAEIKEAITVMSKGSWSSNITEQGHRAASMVKIGHKRMIPVTMQDTSLLIAAKPLFMVKEQRRKIDTLSNRLARVAKRCPNRCAGRQIYIKSLVAKAQHGMQSGMVPPDPSGKYPTKIIAKHAKKWQTMPTMQQQMFEDRAEIRREENRQRNTRDRLAIERQLAESGRAVMARAS